MLKKILIAALWLPLAALAQSYPSPTFQNLTVLGTLTNTGGVPLTSLATQAANTVVANATGATASPTAFAMPSCSANGYALNWTSATGFTCQTLTAHTFNLGTTDTPTFNGLTVNGSTAHGVTIGEGNGTPFAWTAAGTAGQPLLSGGASADPAYGTLGASGGGTGLTTIPQYSVMTGSGTSAVSTVSPGAAGTVLMSNGASAYPSFQSVTPVVYTLVAGDNTAGLQAAINAAVAAGADLKMLGNGSVSGNLTISGALRWYGASRNQTFLTCSTTASCITVNTTLAVDIHDFELVSSVSSGTTTQKLINFSPSTTMNQWSKVHNMNIGASGISIETGGSAGIEIYSNVFGAQNITNAIYIDLEANNTANCNGGEYKVHDNYFVGITGAAQTGVLAQCVGGAYIQHNKFVNVDLPVNFFFPNLDGTGLPTQSGDFFVQGNSMELFAGTAIKIGWAGSNTLDSFEDLMIQDNEIKFPTSQSNGGVINITPSPSNIQWLRNIHITGNDLGGYTSGSNLLVNAQIGLNLDISHNLMFANVSGTQALNVGSAVSGCTLGPNLPEGQGAFNTDFVASTISPTCYPAIAPY
jgi:hypothetical protein